MAHRNLMYFRPPAQKDTYLRARGFGSNGQRSGGLFDPQEVALSSGITLFRLYQDPKGRFGEWWFTPHEMKVVVDYFCRAPGRAFAEGRSAGKGILQATLAVRHGWGGYSPAHLGTFFIVRLREPLLAYFGETDDAPDATQTHNQKAMLILGTDGRQRRTRQIFLPNPNEYEGAFQDLGHHASDTHLSGAASKHDRGALYFE